MLSTGAEKLTKAIEHTGQTYVGIGTLYSEQVLLLFRVFFSTMPIAKWHVWEGVCT